MKLKLDFWDGFDFPLEKKSSPEPEKKHKKSFLEKLLKFFKRR